jgi:uncharacterized protein (TIGR03067 family)
MKSISFFLIISIAILCLSFHTDGSKFNILGRWVTTDSKGAYIEYGFEGHGKYELITKDKQQKTDKITEMKYTFDDSKSPAWIDFEIINKKDPSMSLKIVGIIEIIDENNFKMNLGGMKERPTDFSGSNIATFHRTITKP